MTKLLEGRTAIVYGAGALGGGVARAFAREGARVFLAGRNPEALRAAADGIAQDGGAAETTVLDATDEQAVEAHAAQVLAATGRIDVSFNLITRGDVQGRPLIELSTDELLRAVDTGLMSNFLTARAAARHMVERGSGVILHLNSASGDGAAPGMGSTGPADAATESMMRYLAAELGPRGVRVCGIWTAGVAGTLTKEKLVAVGGDNVPEPEAVIQAIAGMSALRRAPVIDNVAETAVFLASDRAAGITGTMANVTSGLVLR